MIARSASQLRLASSDQSTHVFCASYCLFFLPWFIVFVQQITYYIIIFSISAASGCGLYMWRWWGVAATSSTKSVAIVCEITPNITDISAARLSPRLGLCPTFRTSSEQARASVFFPLVGRRQAQIAAASAHTEAFGCWHKAPTASNTIAKSSGSLRELPLTARDAAKHCVSRWRRPHRSPVSAPLPWYCSKISR